IYNSDNLPQDTIELFYRLNNGPVVIDTLFFIAPKDSVLFTFPGTLDISAKGAHVLDFWLRRQGDNYPLNDSILNYQIRNQPEIAAFPYLEDFESGNGNWYAGGLNSSWQYGAPGSNRLQQAA